MTVLDNKDAIKQRMIGEGRLAKRDWAGSYKVLCVCVCVSLCGVEVNGNKPLTRRMLVEVNGKQDFSEQVGYLYIEKSR